MTSTAVLCGLLLFGVYGTILSFGVFLKPLAVQFGWSRTAVSVPLSLSVALSGLLAIVGGRTTDRFGAFWPTLTGVVIGGLSYWFMPGVQDLGDLSLLLGLGTGIATGLCYTPINTYLSLAAPQKRTFALGLALTGIVLGQMTLSPLAASLIQSKGWGYAFRAFAVILWTLSLPALILMAIRPRRPKKGMKGGRSPLWGAMRSGPFWMIMAIGFVLSTGSYFLTAHLVPYATDRGIPPILAASALTFMGIGGIGGSIAAWGMTRYLGNRGTLILLFLVQGTVFFLLPVATELQLLYGLVLAFGFAYSAAIPIRTALIPRLFDLSHSGVLIGMASASWALGGTIGPLLAGLLYDLRGSYDLGFFIAGGLFVLGALNVQLLDGRIG